MGVGAASVDDIVAAVDAVAAADVDNVAPPVGRHPLVVEEGVVEAYPT